MVRQARGCGVHQVPDGEATSGLGVTESANFSQSLAVCNDGPHRRGKDQLISKLQLVTK